MDKILRIYDSLVYESEKAMAPHSSTLAWKIPWMEEPGGLQSMGSRRVGLSDFTLTFHFHALDKEMVTHSSVLAWRIPGMGEPGRLPSMGSHRVRHDWSDLATAAAAAVYELYHLLCARSFIYKLDGISWNGGWNSREMKGFVSSLKPRKRWDWEGNLYIKAQDLSITPICFSSSVSYRILL